MIHSEIFKHPVMYRSLHSLCSLFLLLFWSALAVTAPFQLSHPSVDGAAFVFSDSTEPSPSPGERDEDTLAFELELEAEDILLDHFSVPGLFPEMLVPWRADLLRLPHVARSIPMPPENLFA